MRWPWKRGDEPEANAHPRVSERVRIERRLKNVEEKASKMQDDLLEQYRVADDLTRRQT